MIRIPAIADMVLAFALPPRCPGCGTIVAGDHRFCLACWSRLTFLGAPACARCGLPFDRAVGPGAECGACMADPPAYDGMAAAVAYGAVARTLALKLKYGGRPGMARTIARFMDRLVPADAAPILVPVPLHRWRIWSRGYNQSALIARAIGRARGLEVADDLIVRHRRTPPLRAMGPAERKRVVRGTFRVPVAARPRLQGRSLLLVDDVFTTGATADACARALRRAGAAEVRLICWARVVRGLEDEDPAAPAER